MDKVINIFIGQDWQKHCDIVSNDEWFNNNVIPDTDFLSKHLELIERLDNSKIDLSTKTIQSRYGVCKLEKLATGFKCLLNCMYLKEKYQGRHTVFFYAGDSIFPLICEVIANTEILLCMSSDCLEMPLEYTYFLNGEKVEDVLDFVDMLYEHEKDVIDFKWVEKGKTEK